MSIELTTLDLLNGLFSLLIGIICTIFGSLITRKYFELKNKLFLYWGIALIGLYSPWWPSASSFVSVMITGEPLPLVTYILIGNLLSPLFLMLFVLGFCEMKAQQKRKIIITIYAIVLTIAEIYVLYFVIVDPTQLGVFTGVFDIKYKAGMIPYLLLIMFTIFIMGALVAWDSIKMEDRELKFKGICLFIGFFTYPAAAIFDANFELTEITLIIVRSILVFGAFLLYVGFFVPKIIKKIFNLE